MSDVVLATANPHKAAEISAVLHAAGFSVLPRPVDVPDVHETADTLEGNAFLKARAVSEATGMASVADDTGLFVDALGGRPGVNSARYAGDTASDADNVARLLGELADVAAPRRAHFRTVIVVAYPDGTSVTADGELVGQIIDAPRGGEGFGYDPVFEPDETPGRTLAELSAEEKNRRSHRGRALAALARIVAEK
ncbi:MAG TPA: RdgB/HAM1 family non-canonical purine NTP pyrophosphatase [Acidimicrobiales bacterium]|nr:RdgB/HAM1 family non-canonical purine NTP pyrophosphatase [Acidimicrobiales bacterium]HVB71053.1 RdgB/HAM1 family non-canonical purine NTP pyrophosphatase [Acidimicrobiales bacterium]